jgi:hypothetical protein
VVGQKCESFEKLGPFWILGLRRNFLKDFKRSTVAKQPFTGSMNSGEVLEGSGFLAQPPHSPGPLVYMHALKIIFIPLATLKASCRNRASNWFLMMVVHLAWLASAVEMTDAKVLLLSRCFLH